MDNTILAKFIESIGSFNNYASSVAQTKQALDEDSIQPLTQNSADVAIFTDVLKGIKAVQKNGFNTDGIIAINKTFDSDSDEQPSLPGHLRNANENADDHIAIILDRSTQYAYYPPEVVTRHNLDQIVDDYQQSSHTENDAWWVFARLAKLQPFQDGNKRTALIAANAAYGTLEKQNYLVLPFSGIDRIDFMTGLMRYYDAKTPEQESTAFNRMISVLPTNREVELRKPIDSGVAFDFKAVHFKPMFRNNDLNL